MKSVMKENAEELQKMQHRLKYMQKGTRPNQKKYSKNGQESTKCKQDIKKQERERERERQIDILEHHKKKKNTTKVY